MIEPARFSPGAAGRVWASGLIAIALVLLVGPVHQTSADTESVDLVFDNVRLVDGTGGPVREGMSVLVRGDRIAAVGSARDVRAPRGARVVQGTGKTLLPGLIDTHIHFRDYVGELFIAHGVTSVRDAGNPTEWILALKKAQIAGEMRGPRIFAVGGILDAPPVMRGHHIAVDSPEAARAATRQLLALGVDGVKVYQKVTAELLRSIADEVHAANRRVIGHISIPADEAARSGIDALEHGSGIALAIAPDPARVRAIPENAGVFGWRFMDPRKADALVALLVERKVAVVPAMASWARGATALRRTFRADAVRVLSDPALAYLPGEGRERTTGYAGDSRPAAEREELEADYAALKDFLKRFKRAGGRIVVGTDGGVLPGLSVHHEMRLLVDAGLTPVEAIHAATGAAAELIQAADIGTIADGKIADLVLVTGNPAVSIDESKNIAMVVQRGKETDITYHRDYRIPIPRPPVAGSRAN